METFHAAHAASPDWLQAANSCLAQLDNTSPGANLGFLYVTDGFTEHLARILAYFKEQTDIEDWVGTVGVGICASGQEYHGEPAMCVMLAEFPAGSFRVFPSIRAGIGEFSRENRDWCAQAAAHFAIVHGDPRNPKTPVLIEQLSETLGGGFLVGGLRLRARGTYSDCRQAYRGRRVRRAVFKRHRRHHGAHPGLHPARDQTQDHRVPGQHRHQARRSSGAGGIPGGNRRAAGARPGAHRRLHHGRLPHQGFGHR